MNFLAAAELGAAALGAETPQELAGDAVVLKDAFAKVDAAGKFDIAALAKLPKQEMVGALNAASRQCAVLAKIVGATEYGYQDVCEVLASLP